MLIPHVETQRTALTIADPSDGVALYELLLGLGLHSMPPLKVFVDQLKKQDISAIFAIKLRHSGETVGFGTLHEMDPAGHIQVGIFTDTDKARYGLGGEAMMLLVNYAFATWEDIRKVYFVTTDASIDRIGWVGDLIPKEATLPKHMFFRGCLWDVHFYAIYRHMWEKQGADVLTRLVRGPEAERPRGIRALIHHLRWLVTRPKPATSPKEYAR
ncbi:GNAT family protein [Streptosporangium sp. NPDC006930]|uniref:GNAT family N-acetyltransferase n=1 Tax=unclassified Streptosporangium TaxID=2632669 RepID=UPI0034274D0A